ncbi:MAG: HAMP domain-containing histidine kinase [Pseudomonadales bacterium]|nr:HAMP domain-containing histidine kinase [Pseudomonadales bacterium]
MLIPAGGRAEMLARLLVLRIIYLSLTAVATVAVALWLELLLPYWILAALLLAGVLSVLFNFARLRLPFPVTEGELAAHLAIDLLLLSAILAISGGSTNPLISFYLVLLAIASAILPGRFSYPLMATAILVYSAYLLHDLDDSAHHLHNPNAFRLHLVGMWVIFVMSALLITLFVSRLAQAVRERDLALNQAREAVLRNEQLVAIGTLAAGTAHALGTPLSTMLLLLEALKEESLEPPAERLVAQLSEQTERCRDELEQLKQEASAAAEPAPQWQPFDQLAELLRQRLLLRAPDRLRQFTLEGSQPAPRLQVDPSLLHALLNLLENALQASKQGIEVCCRWRAGEGQILIDDDGPGIDPAVMERLGEPFITARPGGLGLGLFIANATLERRGGRVTLTQRAKAAGTHTCITLPLQP